MPDDPGILTPQFWAARLRDAPLDQPWRAIWNCTADAWRRAEKTHRTILAQFVTPAASVLDVGCATGRLLNLLPRDWHDEYLGLDLSPDFLARARRDHPERLFARCDLTTDPIPLNGGRPWDVAVLLGFESMIKKYLGPAAWPPVRRKIRAAAQTVLTLDFTRGFKFEAYRDEFEGGE